MKIVVNKLITFFGGKETKESNMTSEVKALDYYSMPIISKEYCNPSQVTLVVRERPHVVNGGGFVVTDYNQKVIFKVDGCGVVGTEGELIVRDGDGDALILIRQKEGLVQALSIHRKWKGYTLDYQGQFKKLVFSLKEPNKCLVENNLIRVSTVPRRGKKDWDFEIRGYFPHRDCRIVDYLGNTVAQIRAEKEIDKLAASNDLYDVVVKPGVDQAFVVGVIAVLDNIYGGSTRC